MKQMKQTTYRQAKKIAQTEKKLDKKHYTILIGLMIFAVVYHYFIEPKTIGHDIKYTIYIFALPTAVGMAILGIYRKQFLITQFARNKEFSVRIFTIFLYLIQGLLFSYLSFGQIAKISWDYCNSQAAKHGATTTLHCPITGFRAGKSPTIAFTLNGRPESIDVTYSTIKPYENIDINDYYIKINVSKGIWNYYVLNEWSIVHK